tara:strand:+ start:1418 stop:1918 length:501 start_codon:yes stop_codon:yes gene_type:complete
MAETTNFPVMRGTIFRITDGSGTPKTYDFILTEGTIELSNAGWEEHRMSNTDGDLLTIVKKGKQTGESTITINAKAFDPGGNASEAVMVDIFAASGYFGSDWSTTGNSNSDFKQFTAALIIPASGGGKTYTMTNAHAKSGFTLSMAPDGMTLAGTLASNVRVIAIS